MIAAVAWTGRYKNYTETHDASGVVTFTRHDDPDRGALVVELPTGDGTAWTAVFQWRDAAGVDRSCPAPGLDKADALALAVAWVNRATQRQH